MPSGSKPGERRGGRQPGTPNKKTALVHAAFDAATSNADLLPLDFLLGVMRDSSISPDWRIKAAQAALPFVHSKPARSPVTDPAGSAKQVEELSEEEALKRDPLYESLQAWARASAEEDAKVQRFRAAQLKNASPAMQIGTGLGGELSGTDAEELEILE
jgi:hypothetical protein